MPDAEYVLHSVAFLLLFGAWSFLGWTWDWAHSEMRHCRHGMHGQDDYERPNDGNDDA